MSLVLVPASSYGQFVRFIEAEQQWHGQLQTSLSRYENAAGVEVDLVAAVHIGDQEYYQALNRYFAGRHLVLYELVTDEAEPNLDQENAVAGASALGVMQTAMASFLDLHFQLDAIDYSQKNLRRADLSMSELRAIMDSKQENFFTMFLSLASAQMASEQQARQSGARPASSLTLVSLLTALAAEDQGRAIKFLIGQELGRSGGIAIDAALESQITILGDRNAAVIAELQQDLEAGQAQRISLFYGAAHMPGIEKSLQEELGFKFVERRWLDAWTIP